MLTSWEFKQSLFTTLSRRRAWEFLSDMQNHAEMEGVTIELDGPFQTGTKGRTIASDWRQEWELDDVIPDKRFVIVGKDSEFELSFAWEFDDEGTGTRLTQRIGAIGPESQMNKWEETLRQTESNARQGKEQFAAKLDRLGDVGADVA